MENVNFMQVIPNSHSFATLRNISTHYQIVPEELTKEYLLIGLENTKKRGYEIKQFGEVVHAVPIFPSIDNMINFINLPDFDLKLFIDIIENTLVNNIDLMSKLKIERKEIYGCIDGERDYQDANWGMRRQADGTPDEEKPVAEWINYIEYHLSKAKERVYHLDTEGATHELRKVAALAVRAMEIHGCPERIIVLDHNPDDKCIGGCECDENGNPIR
jgi:hypothetical protein